MKRYELRIAYGNGNEENIKLIDEADAEYEKRKIKELFDCNETHWVEDMETNRSILLIPSSISYIEVVETDEDEEQKDEDRYIKGGLSVEEAQKIADTLKCMGYKPVILGAKDDKQHG